ncbi:hypothetical protein FQN54_009501 [Arachnomyces sp. PD_36]|nr:hypothetical protein FQN54_009501 [Arachnomyces sp. PD_36]
MMMKSSFLLALCAVLPLALAAPTTSQLSARETDEEATDRLLFDSAIEDFIAARDATDPASLDWSSDGCSSSPDNPGFDFLNSCYRHDFGYRNYKAQDRFSDENKDSIDTNFKNDLYNQCETEDSVDTCKGIADIYYWAVSNIGSKRPEEVEVVA